jgi:hypothetical protein
MKKFVAAASPGDEGRGSQSPPAVPANLSAPVITDDDFEDATQVYDDIGEFVAKASRAAGEIALGNIARKSAYLREDAESIGRYLRAVDGLPEFETQAEDELERAELALTETLLAVKLARSAMTRKRRHVQAAE